MNVSLRMQKIRLGIQSITESVTRNLNAKKGELSKDDTVGSIEHEAKIARRDLLLLIEELRNIETRK